MSVEEPGSSPGAPQRPAGFPEWRFHPPSPSECPLATSSGGRVFVTVRSAGAHSPPSPPSFPSTCVAGHLQCRVEPSCRLHGGWSPWGPWAPCTQTCGEGVRLRFRQCDNPAPQNGGRGCLGSAEQQRPCPSQQDCPGKEGVGWAGRLSSLRPIPQEDGVG